MLLEVKRTLQTVFGDDALAMFKLSAELSHDPAVVRRTGADVADVLKKKALPKPKIAGIKEVDASPWVTKVKKTLKRLDAASKKVSDEVRQAQVTLEAKNRALELFETRFGAAAAAGWALLTAAGDKAQAARISLSPRRPSTGGKGSGENGEEEPK